MKVTKRDLNILLIRINTVTDNALEPWVMVKGKLKASVGTYLIDSAYGGYKLAQLTNEAGGQRDITYGFVSKTELYFQMQAFLAGLTTNNRRFA